MGYTCTGHVEIKVDGRWLHWDHESISGSYEFYTALGLSKNDKDGDIPADATETTRLDFSSDPYEHKFPNCLGRKEVDALRSEYSEYQPWINYWYPVTLTPEDARLIVWFEY